MACVSSLTRLLLAFDGKFLRPWPPAPFPGVASWNPDVAGLGAWAGSPGVMGAGRPPPPIPLLR